MGTAKRVAQALLERLSSREARAQVWEALVSGRIDGYQAIAVLAWLE